MTHISFNAPRRAERLSSKNSRRTEVPNNVTLFLKRVRRWIRLEEIARGDREGHIQSLHRFPHEVRHVHETKITLVLPVAMISPDKESRLISLPGTRAPS